MKIAAIMILTLTSTAIAEDKLAADGAFRAAKDLERAGKLGEACPLYEASYRADPQLGALLNLANCHEQIGRTGRAWVELREALELATRRNDHRVAFAQQRLAALEPRLVRMRIEAPPGITVERDGTDVTPLIAQALVVDPGTYKIRATAPQHVPWETSIAVAREGETVRVEVPPLAPITVEALPPPAPTVVSHTPTDVVPPVVPRTEPDRPRGRRTAALVLGGSGLAALGLGAGFGVHARSLWQASRDPASCSDHDVCNATGLAQIDRAKSSAKIATFAMAGGAALVVAAGVVWLTAPKPAERSVAVVPAIDSQSVGVTAFARF